MINNKKGNTLFFNIVSFYVILLLVIGFAGNTFASEKNNNKVLKIALATDMLTFDNHNYHTGQDAVTQNWIYERLVIDDKEGNIHPHLAVSWEKLSDTKWQFKLRQDVYFTDGTQFNSEVVKTNLERGNIAPRGSGFLGFIESVTIIDEFTVVLNLKYPYGPILNNLCHPVAGMMSKAAIEKYGVKVSNNPVGSGPFKLLEWIPNDHVYFEQNKDYWGELPAIERIEIVVIPEESTRLMALLNGEVDLIENPPPHEVINLENNPKTYVIKDPRARNVWLGFTHSVEPLGNRLVRKAIQHAIDINSIVEGVLEGLGRPATESGYIPPEISPTLSPITIPHDIEYAKELLKEAGYENGLNLRLWTPENRYLRDKEVAQVLQQQLQEVGISVDITVMEFGSYLAALSNHEADLFIMGWGFMTGDASQALRQTFSTGNAFNYSNYSNPKFDELLSLAEQEFDPNKRAKYYQEINELLVLEDAAVAPLYYMYNVYGARSNITGVRITPNELIDLTNADVK